MSTRDAQTVTGGSVPEATGPEAPETQVAVGVLTPVAEAAVELSGPDYRDDQWIARTGSQPPEWWARTAFEEVIKRVPRFILFRVVIGLHTVRGGHVIAGWHVAESTDRLVRLTRGGRRNSAELLVVATDEEIHLVLGIRHGTGFGRAVWKRLAPVHRSKSRVLLREAWRRASAG